MNASEIYTGEYYAWHPYRAKGTIPIGAAKVEVTRVRRVKQLYEKNRRTQVTIKVLEKGTGSSVSYYDVGRELTVSSRELIDYWAFYKDEEAALLKEEERRTYNIRKNKARREVTKELLQARLSARGLQATSVSLQYDGTVTVSLKALLDWLQISEEEIVDAVLEIVGPPIESTSGYTTD